MMSPVNKKIQDLIPKNKNYFLSFHFLLLLITIYYWFLIFNLFSVVNSTHKNLYKFVY